jgi:hypothetical protein
VRGGVLSNRVAAAATLFASLGYVSAYFFTKTHTDGRKLSPKKPCRNTIYRVCGFAIWAALAPYGLFLTAQRLVSGTAWVRALVDWPLLFVVETVCLSAFGFSWLLKGDGVYGLSDPPEQRASTSSG